MSGTRFYTPYAELVSAVGVPLVGAKLNFYLTGSSTRTNTYSNAGLTVANANPVVATLAPGTFPDIFLDPTITYKVVATDADDVQLWTADPVSGAGPFSGTTIITAVTVTLAAGAAYGFRTLAGALTGNLPALSSVSTGATITVFDQDNDAGTNNVTIQSSGSDQILYGAATDTRFLLDTDSCGIRLTAGPAAWRAIAQGPF